MQDFAACKVSVFAGAEPKLFLLKRETRKIVLVMRITSILLLAATLQVSAKGWSQEKISLYFTNAPLEQVFNAIKAQTDVAFFYRPEYIKGKNVTINIASVSLKAALDACLKNQELTYEIVGKTVAIRQVKKNETKEVNILSEGQNIDVHGRVLNEKGEPVSAVTVTIKGTSISTITNERGEFAITNVNHNAVLIFTHVSMESFELKVGGKTELTISLRPKVKELSDVTVQVNTGYQEIPKERATGAFVKIDNELINRRVSTDILQRLNGVTSGLLFISGSENDFGISGPNPRSNLKIRSTSTIYSSKFPLIIVDNFPFDGDINSINPNDVESITVLKDAAAASIWGTKAGNGVIVITTKNGKYNHSPNIVINSNFSISDKADLFYQPTLNSADYIDIETFLFEKGFYNSNINSIAKPALTPAVEILLKQKNGVISESDASMQLNELKNLDVRNDLLKYYFNKPIKQQYAININGGGHNHHYFASVGYDHNLNNISEYSRLTLAYNNTFLLLDDKLEISTGISYSHTITKSLGTITSFSYPYARLADEFGQPLSIALRRKNYIDTAGRGNLLDWTFYPLEELNYVDNKVTGYNYRITTGIKYKFMKGLDVSIKYQHVKFNNESRDYKSLQTYFTRDLINQFTNLAQVNPYLRNPIPLGGIIDLGNNNYSSKNIRAQMNYDLNWGQHKITTLLGSEIQDASTKSNSYRAYGYDEKTGSSIPVDYTNLYKNFITGFSSNIPFNQGFGANYDRFASLFANAAYSFSNRYIISGSARKDGSNIFGTNNNNKWKPLWSIGAKWNISNETFYKINWLSDLQFRITYGYQGNVNNTTAALLTITNYGNPNNWGLLYAGINNPPNPDLRWEKIGQLNTGIDFSLINNRISGTLEYYRKKGVDLISDAIIPPSAGWPLAYKSNAADIKGEGVDITLKFRTFTKKIKWTTSFLFSYAKDWVSSYKNKLTSINGYVTGGLNPIVGKPVFSLFSYKWAGLDPTTGDPQGYIDGQISKDYVKLVSSSNLGDMVYNGPIQAPYFGSILNTLSWNQISVSFNIVYKLGYYFRRPSINYSSLFSSMLNISQGTNIANSDYANRWQKAGDENFTYVPSFMYPANINRDQFYNFSEVLVEKGDHIRLQDISFSYDFNNSQFRKLPFKNVRLYVYASNLGLIWRANKLKIDPDYPKANSYFIGLPGRTFTTGLKIEF